VHRHEGEVHADEHQPEVDLPEALVEEAAGHLREPVVDAGEDAEHRSTEEHVVDVSHHPVGAVQVVVDGQAAEVDTVDATDEEEQQKAHGEEHGRVEADAAAP
jgi:hypothetical protein